MATRTPGCESSGRFHSAAAHYLAGRPPYAPLLIRRVAALTGLKRQHAVLDLGCGPGMLARAFAPMAREVVAMDPEPEMLAAATEYCRDFGNVRLVPGGSNDLTPSLGQFRLVVMGRSFHWMDRAETLRRLDALIEPGGTVVHFHTDHPEVSDNAWTERFRALRRRYAGEAPDRPQAPGDRWLRHEAFLLASAFCCLESHAVFERRNFPAAHLVDRAFSMSATAPARLGARAAALERDIAALIREIAPGGSLTEVITSSALVARRPGEEATS